MPTQDTYHAVYRLLDRHFGPLDWWPGRTRFEIIVGAILTQNTSWQNVEKAIRLLRQNGLLSPKKMKKTPVRRLAGMVRPSGYYNQKALKLKNFLGFLDTHFQGSLGRMGRHPAKPLRDKLLRVKGIGPETADSILLYAFGKPVFVVDAYTRRIFGRLGLLNGNESYDDIRSLFEKRVPDARLYNQYHALIVNLGKHFCRKQRPACGPCPLSELKQCQP